MQGVQSFLNLSCILFWHLLMIGTCNHNGKMFLIDPQAHMCVIPAGWPSFVCSELGHLVLRTEPRTENTIYWDGGKNKIAAWKAQHLPNDVTSSSNFMTSSADHASGSLCEHNRICSVLGLHTLEMADFDDQPLPSKPMAKKTNLDFLVHERDIE